MSASPYDIITSLPDKHSDDNDSSIKDFSSPRKYVPFSGKIESSSFAFDNISPSQDIILPFEETLLVPDSMADIDALLFSEASAKAIKNDKGVYSADDKIDCDITIYTVYRPVGREVCPIDVIKSSISFSHTSCFNNFTSPQLKTSVSVSSIEPSLINERKFRINGNLRLRITCINPFNNTLLQATDDTMLKLLKKTMAVSVTSSEKKHSTEISQEITLNDNQPKPLEILKQKFAVHEIHRQVSSGKLILNACIHSAILYKSYSDEIAVAGHVFKTDFTQFIPLDSDISNPYFNISFNTDNLKVSTTEDNKLLISGDLITVTETYENIYMSMLTDAYHKRRNLVYTTTPLELCGIDDMQESELSVRDVIGITDMDEFPEKILYASIDEPLLSASVENEKIIVEGKVTVKLIAENSNEKPYSICREIPLRSSFSLPQNEHTANDFICDGTREISIYCDLKDFWHELMHESRLEINATFCIKLWVFCRYNVNAIDTLSFDETSPLPVPVSMALYTADGNETLWDIAKKYKSDIETLESLNNINRQDDLPEGLKLLISK